MTLQRTCRNALIVVRTMCIAVFYSSMAISSAGIAKAVWLLIDAVMERGQR